MIQGILVIVAIYLIVTGIGQYTEDREADRDFERRLRDRRDRKD